jgi:hypothetical protein
MGCKNIPGLYCEEHKGNYNFTVLVSGAKNMMATGDSMVFILQADSSFNQSGNNQPLGVSTIQFFLNIERKNNQNNFEQYTNKDVFNEMDSTVVIHDKTKNAFIIFGNHYFPDRIGTSIQLPIGDYRITLHSEAEVSYNRITESGMCYEYTNCSYYLQQQVPLILSGNNQFEVEVE